MKGTYIPILVSLMLAAVWLAGWMATWGLMFSVPSLKSETSGRKRAKLANVAFVLAPVAFTIHVTVLGSVFQVKYNRARVSQVHGNALPGELS